MKLICIKPIDGFTVGNTYELLGCAAEYVQLEDDDHQVTVIHEVYFDIVKEKNK